jgi:peptidoglycan/LPS O-acetylase OafA/YrhL
VIGERASSVGGVLGGGRQKPGRDSSSTVGLHDGARLPVLDGIRGLAILLVMCCHFFQYGGMQPTAGVDRLAHTLGLAGWIGVDLFFVLSGYLITRILLQSKGGVHYFRNFYIRRTLRIFPLYYAACVLVFLATPLIVEPSPAFRRLLSEQGWYWSYLANVSIARDGWPDVAGSVGHFWSLAVEEQFYLFWPAVILVFRRTALFWVIALFIATSLALRVGLSYADHAIAAYVLTAARMDALSIGAIVALLTADATGVATAKRWARPACVGACMGLAAIVVWEAGLDPLSPAVQVAGYSLLAVGFAAFIVVAVTSPGGALRKVLETKLLVLIGQRSYALYVFHLPIAVVLGKHVLGAQSLPTVAGSQLPGQLAFMIVAFTISYAAACMSWYGYEAHFLELRRLFPYGRPDEQF